MLTEILVVLYKTAPQNVKKFLTKKYAKITKRSHAYKDYASCYNVNILNSVNPELKVSLQLEIN